VRKLQADSSQPHNTGLLRLRTIKTGDTEELDALPLANSANFSHHPSPHTPRTQTHKVSTHKNTHFSSLPIFNRLSIIEHCEFRRSFSPGKIPFKGPSYIRIFFSSAFLQNFDEMMKKHRHRMGLIQVFAVRSEAMRCENNAWKMTLYVESLRCES
jgi:hypothetical protein